MRTSVILSAVVLFLTASVMAQGEYLDKGCGGIGIGTGFLTNRDANGFGGTVGLSVAGVVDLSVSYTRLSTDGTNYGCYGGGVAIFLIKHHGPNKTSLALTAAIQRDNPTNRDGLTTSQFGLATFHRLGQKPNLFGLLSLGVNYVNVVEWVGEPRFAFGSGVALCFKQTNKNVLAIGPSIQYYDETLTFLFSLSYTLSGKATGH